MFSISLTTTIPKMTQFGHLAEKFFLGNHRCLPVNTITIISKKSFTGNYHYRKNENSITGITGTERFLNR